MAGFAPIMTPLQMKAMIDTLAGVMNSTAKRLSMRAKDYVVAGGGDVEEVRRLLEIAERLPLVAQHLVDYAYGTRHLPEPEDRTSEDQATEEK